MRSCRQDCGELGRSPSTHQGEKVSDCRKGIRWGPGHGNRVRESCAENSPCGIFNCGSQVKRGIVVLLGWLRSRWCNRISIPRGTPSSGSTTVPTPTNLTRLVVWPWTELMIVIKLLTLVGSSNRVLPRDTAVGLLNVFLSFLRSCPSSLDAVD